MKWGTGSAPPRPPGSVSPAKRHARAVAVMGTVVSLDVRTDAPDRDVEDVLDAGKALLASIDADFSTWSAHSWVSRLARGEVELIDLPVRVRKVLLLSDQAEQRSDGWFTPRWRGGTVLDPTGLVKGWAAQQVSDLFLHRGFRDHCVNAAGDVVLAGSPAPGLRWRVGITDPTPTTGLIGFTDGIGHREQLSFGETGRRWSVATSGTSERGRHVVDPTTGEPAMGLVSATVIGCSGAQTDAYATAVLAAGGRPELVHSLQARGWVVITVAADGVLTDPGGYLHRLPVP